VLPIKTKPALQANSGAFPIAFASVETPMLGPDPARGWRRSGTPVRRISSASVTKSVSILHAP